MDSNAREIVNALTKISPTKVFFETAKEGMSDRMEKNFQRIADVVASEGAITYGNMWQIGYHKMKLLLEQEDPPISPIWVDTLEQLSGGGNWRFDREIGRCAPGSEASLRRSLARPKFLSPGLSPPCPTPHTRTQARAHCV